MNSELVSIRLAILKVYQNHVDDLLKHRLLGSTTRDSYSRSWVRPENLHFSLVMLMCSFGDHTLRTIAQVDNLEKREPLEYRMCI